MGRLLRYNLVATFPDMTSARDAVEALGQAGVDGNNISLLGRPIEEAAVTRDTRESDFNVIDDIAKKTATGAAAGGVVGGALAGAAAFLVPGIGPVVGAGIWAAAAGGALAGGAAGGMVGGISALPLNEDWELTYQDSVRQGRVLVATHTNDAAETRHLLEVLDKANPEKIERLDAAGRPVEQASLS